MNTDSVLSRLLSEIELFKELTEILHRETECLVSRDSDGLSETMGSALRVADRLEDMERARGRVSEVARVAGAIPGGVGAPSASLDGQRGADYEELLRYHHGVLLALIYGAREINRVNRVALRGVLREMEMRSGHGPGKHACADCKCATLKPGEEAPLGEGCACASGF